MITKPFISFSFALLSLSLTLVNTEKAEAALVVNRTVVANQLNNPRGVAFDAGGALYITEVGTGGASPSIPGPSPTLELVFGSSGAITRVQNGIQERVITGLPSLAFNRPGNVLPPSGSTGPTIGSHDLTFDENGDLLVVLGYSSNPIYRGNLGSAGADLGQVIKYRLDGSGTWQRQPGFAADFAGYELSNNPDGRDTLSNPYSIEPIGNGNYLVVDSGGNDLLQLDSTGNINLITTFDTRPVGNFTTESVPTAAVQGTDGAYYVSELTGFPYPEGGARVYRVVPGQAPEIYADGFTQILGLTFDRSGNLYVLEYAVQSQATPNNNLLGSLIQIAPDRSRTTVINPDGTLIAPNHLALGPDGNIYLANRSIFAGQGEIIRLDINTVPEPTFSPISAVVLSLGLFGLTRRFSR